MGTFITRLRTYKPVFVPPQSTPTPPTTTPTPTQPPETMAPGHCANLEVRNLAYGDGGLTGMQAFSDKIGERLEMEIVYKPTEVNANVNVYWQRKNSTNNLEDITFGGVPNGDAMMRVVANKRPYRLAVPAAGAPPGFSADSLFTFTFFAEKINVTDVKFWAQAKVGNNQSPLDTGNHLLVPMSMKDFNHMKATISHNHSITSVGIRTGKATYCTNLNENMTASWGGFDLNYVIVFVVVVIVIGLMILRNRR